MIETPTPDRDPPLRPVRRARPRQGPLHHVAQLCLGVVVAGLVIVLAVAAVLGAGVTAPGWISERVEARVSDRLADHRLDFETMEISLDAGMAPQVALRDVTLRDAGGTALADLARLDITLSRAVLLRGALAPSAVRLAGGRLILRRAADGTFSVAFETGEDGGRHPPRDRPFPEQIGAMLSRPMLAELEKVTIREMRLRYEDARSGTAWSADGGRASLERTGDRIALRGNVIVLGDREYASSLEVNYSGALDGSDSAFGVRFEDVPAREIAGQSPALAWLGALEAPISGAVRAEIADGVRLGPLDATLQIGAGALRPNPATAPIPFRAARTYFTYRPENREIAFSEISVESDWGTARAEGRARLVGMQAGWPRGLEAQIELGEIAANPAGLYPEPVVFDGASAALRLDLDPFALRIGALRLRDGARTLHLSGEARARADGWSVDVAGRLARLAPARLLALWPPTLKPKTRRWLDENVLSTELREIQMAMRARPGAAPEVALGFDFDELSATYVRNVPPIEAASGRASIRDNRLTVHAETGHVTAEQGGRVDISGTDFIIPDIRIKRGPAEAHLRATGSITAALSLLDSPPFRFLEKAGRPVTLAEGRADLEGRLDFILKDRLTPEEVAFEVSGHLADLRSERLMQGRVLTAARLDVAADNAALGIGGEARIGDVPVTGRWRMPLGPGTGGASTLSGGIEISARFLDEFGIALPPDSVSGRTRGAVEVALARDTPAEFTLTSDLTGLGLRIPALGWVLPERAGGRLDVAGTLGAPPEIDRLDIEAGGLSARGSVNLTPAGALEVAQFSRLALDDWLEIALALRGRGPGRAPRAEIAGGRVDLRDGTLGSGGGGAGGPLRVRLDELRLSDTLALTALDADLDTSGGMSGRFDARVNGRAPVSGEVSPGRDGRSAFRIRSGQAGAILAAAGTLREARGGALDLRLTPAGPPRSFDGVLAISNVRINDAPALAALLNTISVVGLLEQFNGQGLHFSDVDARFRLTPDRLVLLESSAVGASAGISMDGYFDLARKRLDMQGVLSPVYVLNVLGGALTPRRGEGLFGFNFTLSGPASDPSVTVNPLSALTPGFLRELFRRSSPQVEGASRSRSPRREETGIGPSRPERRSP